MKIVELELAYVFANMAQSWADPELQAVRVYIAGYRGIHAYVQ